MPHDMTPAVRRDQANRNLGNAMLAFLDARDRLRDSGAEAPWKNLDLSAIDKAINQTWSQLE